MRPSILMWRELDAKNLLVLYFLTMLQGFLDILIEFNLGSIFVNNFF